MIKTITKIITGAVVMAAFSCGGTGKGASADPGEFFSGSVHMGTDEVTTLTECTTRITMRFDHGGDFDRLRRHINDPGHGGDQTARIEFYGRILDESPSAAVPVVRIDTIVNICGSDDCLTDYLLPGIYRRQDGEGSVILRLRPRYLFVIQEFNDSGEVTLSSGRWSRSSLLTVELYDEATGERSSFQIIPTQDSLARIDDNRSETYVREWL